MTTEIYTTDIVIGLQYGDEGKGKIVHMLAARGAYDFCVRYCGGANAGHTIYHNGQKIVTHQVPSGALFGIPCIIGDNCYLDVDKLIAEMQMLSKKGFNDIKLYVSLNAHIITSNHLEQDGKDSIIGTTKSGIGPCATSKYGRTGIKLSDKPDAIGKLRDIGVDCAYPVKVFMQFYHANKRHARVLVEGAQAWGLDITHGDYPYVTSSHCLATDCLNMGINMHPNDKHGNQYAVRIWGVAKAYETYVGAKKFQPDDDPVLNKIQEVGAEFGSTTGRKRQCNYLNMDVLKTAAFANQVTHVVINKCDVLQHPDINTFNYITSPSADKSDLASLVFTSKRQGVVALDDVTEFEQAVTEEIMEHSPSVARVIYEYSPSEASQALTDIISPSGH
jgi:adenylosuccinate synthase